ncbi:High-affinity branched-chain amino acid transport system permease protein LivH [subsurface metagenome]
MISLLNGISFGMILFLLTIGLSLTLGLMGIVNLSHGVLFMVGGYVGWTVAVQLGLNYWLAVLLGGIAAGLVGLAIERGFLRFLYKLMNEQVMLTIGFIYILTNLSLWVWGGLPRAPFTASVLSGSFPIGDWTYPVHRIATIGIGLIFVIGLWWLLEKTRVGAIVRAGMDDKEMVAGLGINLGRVTYLIFFLGAFMAGIAGVIGAQTLAVNLAMGWDILLLALIVLVVGGIGSMPGALLGAMVIGLINAFGIALFPEIAMFLMYLVMIIVLLVKPSGLLPRGA